MPERNLTLKQERFVTAYLGPASGNGAAACRLAGYRGSPKALSEMARQNLGKPGIRARIQQVLDAESISANEVLQRLTAIARADWRHLVRVRHDMRGEVVDARLVLADQVRALELLGKYHGLWTERHDVSATVLRIEGLDVNAV
jgi:phage terminase small subunit